MTRLNKSLVIIMAIYRITVNEALTKGKRINLPVSKNSKHYGILYNGGKTERRYLKAEGVS